MGNLAIHLVLLATSHAGRCELASACHGKLHGKPLQARPRTRLPSLQQLDSHNAKVFKGEPFSS